MLLAHAGDAAFQPAGVVLFSPLIDLTLGLAERQETVRRDPAMSAGAARRMVSLYTRGTGSGSSAAQARFQRGAGTATHADPGRRVRDARRRCQIPRRPTAGTGGVSTLEIWPGMVHVFQALPKLAPEATVALRRAANFIADRFSDELQEIG